MIVKGDFHMKTITRLSKISLEAAGGMNGVNQKCNLLRTSCVSKARNTCKVGKVAFFVCLQGCARKWRSECEKLWDLVRCMHPSWSEHMVRLGAAAIACCSSGVGGRIFIGDNAFFLLLTVQQ